MTDRSFVDTKVLVYARDASEPRKKELAVEWIRTLWTRASGRLSFQVLFEYYEVLTRRPSHGIRLDNPSWCWAGSRGRLISCERYCCPENR